MFAPANIAHFTLDIPRIDHDFKVLSFQGTEAISQPYCFELDLVSERPDLDIEGLLHQPVFLSYAGPDKGIHGLIHSVAQGESGKRLTRYRVTLVPRLAYLQHATNQRIFQHKTVPQIITEVLKGHGIFTDSFRFQLREEGPERIYCTQYGETDLHFIQRLCEEEGIHYHFQHSSEGHQLVFGEDQTIFPTLPVTKFNQGSGMAADEPVIKRFNLRLQTRPSHVTRRDYNFEKPRLLMESAAQSEAMPALEDYDYPGRFNHRDRGTHLATRTLETHRADYRLVNGESDQPLLISGHFLALAEHPRQDWNDLWLLTSVTHEGKQPQVLEESVTSDANPEDGFTQGYRNTFTATPWDVIFRPQTDQKKQTIAGSQSAVITGPENEEIHCDEYGRVKVQFHWDRHGQADAKTSCWLRVASNWAGDRYGGIAIPRIGMEVLVSFLEGDPDQPLITGCLYHKTHQVPYNLPEHKTRSVFKTLSTPGGDGFNELRIDNKAGEEQIFIHAQRDWDQNIQHDQTIRIGNERHDRVEANSYTELLVEEHRTTHADRKTEIRADDHLTVANNQHIKLGDGQFIEAGQEIHLSSGMKVVLEAGSEITLKAGGSFIKIDPSGVSLVGPSVKMISGGSAGKGSGAAPTLPAQALSAGADKAGGLLILAGENNISEILIPAQKQALQRAATQAQPFCAICEQQVTKQ
ncbi:type VI secretion system secreted protein VgrG [Halopseudomonas litoralis]|uniref:Type VI secretion system secreted protein VgrG n=1 Tax=Halopseudomonas litoralis TaxID=797277 RepID=A0A1H1M358_9GAMM|nr:type VI secretion system tip protein TssI/VgrG [Halopseudomonas litoralis]SDR80459.1 type VI secretion system secreted protein VgrG [Halopseudomonas litoralis]